ncbi:MAG: PQQ-like beta-propeller repeat protein [Candidatus Hydrogenedentes bacterium]|nr:PQQ-like beta-propeller repeat protein [Candidatus Hydrogenedentota bacterium]
MQRLLLPFCIAALFIPTSARPEPSAAGASSPVPPPFESLGVPVRKAGLMGVLVGPGPEDGTERIYFNFRQDGGKLFLVAVDPATGASAQFKSPAGTGAWGFIVGPDQKIYLGTHEGPDPLDSGQILVFDPKHPELLIQIVGRPAESESYLWQFCVAPDGKLYAGTYPTAKLVSFDPKTGAMAELGVMDPDQKYTRNLAIGPDGKVYLGIGYGRANVVAYDPATGTHTSILPEEYRNDPAQTTASVWKGSDGNVYVSATKMSGEGDQRQPQSVTLTPRDGQLVEAPAPPGAADFRTLKDGRRVLNENMNGTYDLVSPDGTVEHRTFTYAGDGAGLFMVSNGPLGRIYGGTYMPNELFWYDPATGALENPGNPSEVGGETYSMLDHHGVLYLCAYPGSFLSKWDPKLPWNYGRAPENNPRGFGPLGVGHLRPRAMIHGPEERLYIGSYPEYGRHGGSLGVWDPREDTLIENYHHLIKNQAIISLVYDAESDLIFGGSSTQGGGGTDPIEPEAKFFAFDPATKALSFEMVPVSGVQYIRSLCLLGRKVYGVANADTLFVYDISQKEIVHTAPLGVGSVLDCSLQPWKEGQLYGIASTKIFRLDPQTYAVTVLAEYPRPIRCGFAIDEHGLYFGDRAELVRFKWKVE